MGRNIDNRNSKVTEYLDKLYLLASNNAPSTGNMPYESSLTAIFDSKTMSYREIILVALVGRMLDDSFRAYSHFYGCKPRAIFEGPIKDFCNAKGFPHTKSGPLNIAKASNINEAWASQRDPKIDADFVVDLIKLIDSKDDAFQTNLGVDLMRKYISSAQHIQSLTVEFTPSTNPIHLEGLCRKMIDGALDSGNTPQRIFGFLLESYHTSIHTGIIVSGADDSASATSTTSKKPGDINEEGADGSIYRVYEVTVKPFDLSRIIDSYDCIKKYNDEKHTHINEIVVVCRKRDCPSDIKHSPYHFCLGTYEYQDVIYYYWDIYEWISYMLQHMIPAARENFYSRLNSYVNDTNTHEAVKVLWNALHQNNS